MDGLTSSGVFTSIMPIIMPININRWDKISLNSFFFRISKTNVLYLPGILYDQIVHNYCSHKYDI